MEDHVADLTRLTITDSAVLFTDDEIHDDVAITKELFFLVIQDPAVQAMGVEKPEPPPQQAHKRKREAHRCAPLESQKFRLGKQQKKTSQQSSKQSLGVQRTDATGPLTQSISSAELTRFATLFEEVVG